MTAIAWLLKEGYEVFRNVSQHGLIDILGVKNGEIFKFDVKSANADKNVRLSSDQIINNVKLLKVFSDGSCEIDWEPEEAYEHSEAICKHCDRTYTKRRRRSIFCSKTCKVGYHAKIKRLGAIV
jgi:Holliday junction resolvase